MKREMKMIPVDRVKINGAYEAPNIEMIEVRVEQGFAASGPTLSSPPPPPPTEQGNTKSPWTY